MLKDREAWPAAVHGVTKSQTRLIHWTTNSKWEIFAFCSICFLVSALFHLAWCPQGPSTSSYTAEFTSFSRPDTIPLSVCLSLLSVSPSIFYLSTLLIYYLCICLCYLISHLLSLLLSIYLGTYLCYYLHYLSICLSVYLPIHPSIYLSFYPSLSLSHICFIHSSIHRHVGCSCILAILNKTTTNIVMQLPFEVLISSLTPSSPLVIRRSVLLDHTVQHLHADLGY